ncbi:VOC family protein [Micromonospora avicenniae]|uniref:VOC family protein n=1 Tax=Micromonospora avicenniae TaxID=1198245 RepID=UPI00331FF645
MSGEAPVRVALRVSDVSAATTLYRSFGFVPVGTVPGPDGDVVMAILRRGPLQLLVDALVGIPFPDSVRERQTKLGPRGLGVVIGLEVEDVEEAARRCQAAGCVIGTGPVDAPWGERYVEFEGPVRVRVEVLPADRLIRRRPACRPRCVVRAAGFANGRRAP